MGELNVRIAKSQAQSQKFIKHILSDVKAVEYMLVNNWFEDDITRIGAEQELCIVDENYKPAHKNVELLKEIGDDDIVTELAKFNIELNLSPQELTANCFRKLENEILEKMDKVNLYASQMGMSSILTGILPTIRKSDVAQENVTPFDRYKLLLKVLNRLRGSKVQLKIGGTDELMVQHDSALMEACNTSFQVHLQIKSHEFVDKYNFAQIIAAPVMAIAVNSPILFGRRLWHETRIALFQQSLDTRKQAEHLRERSPRVVFGERWLENSITDLYKEDIARYQVLLNTDIENNSMDLIEDGKVPKLRALNIHNGTIYRWNRPCYGISPNGKPHLRIENRIIPSGPSVLDEVANAAFWIGLMNGFEGDMKDVTTHFAFDDARNNFYAACRYGINSYFHWLDGERVSAIKLIREKLLPIAQHGLEKANVDAEDIKRYLGVIEQRVEKKITGASWMLNNFNVLIKTSTRDEAITAVTSKIIQEQSQNKPVHDWDDACLSDIENWSPHSLKVEEFMTTNIYTSRPSDLIDLAADIIDWRKIRHIPVENKHGHLVGVISSRNLLRYYRELQKDKSLNKATVKDIMVADPITIKPNQTILEAIKLMEDHNIGCLPVVKNRKLVGMVTEVDFLHLSTRLMKRLNENVDN